MVGTLRRVELRTIWQSESRDFTPWLQENLAVLNEVLDLNLASAEREQETGQFNVDLVAEDESGNTVIIENQLEKSNHDHLGKLITYLSAVGAKTAIWIVSDPRPEHVKAVTWLNESAAAGFYLLKLEAVQIDDSPPAPLLTVIVGPSEESREVGRTKSELVERDVLRRRFWTGLLEKAREHTSLHANISPKGSNWIGTSAGKRGLGYNYVVRQHESSVELYIDRGRDADEENKAIFDALAESKEAIESAFGEPLEWDRLDGRRACRIEKLLRLGGYRDDEAWPEVHEATIQAMVRLEKAFKPHVSKLRV